MEFAGSGSDGFFSRHKAESAQYEMRVPTGKAVAKIAETHTAGNHAQGLPIWIPQAITARMAEAERGIASAQMAKVSGGHSATATIAMRNPETPNRAE